MAYRKAQITQAELTRCLKAYRDAGLPVVRTEIDPRTGRIVIHSDASAAQAEQPNPWDDA